MQDEAVRKQRQSVQDDSSGVETLNSVPTKETKPQIKRLNANSCGLQGLSPASLLPLDEGSLYVWLPTDDFGDFVGNEVMVLNSVSCTCRIGDSTSNENCAVQIQIDRQNDLMSFFLIKDVGKKNILNFCDRKINIAFKANDEKKEFSVSSGRKIGKETFTVSRDDYLRIIKALQLYGNIRFVVKGTRIDCDTKFDYILEYDKNQVSFWVDEHNATDATVDTDATDDTNQSTFNVDCNGMLSVDNPSGLSGELAIPSDVRSIKVESIAHEAFRSARFLTKIIVPSSVKSIGFNAFYDCSNLESVTLPDSITSIDQYAFNGCTGLRRFAIPDSVVSIGECSFGNCRNLTTIMIPMSVVSIGPRAFCNCNNLELRYKGSREKWDLIKKDSKWDEDSVLSICFDCSE